MFFLVIPDFGCFFVFCDRVSAAVGVCGSLWIITVNYRLFGLLKCVRVLIAFFIALKFGGVLLVPFGKPFRGFAL